MDIAGVVLFPLDVGPGTVLVLLRVLFEKYGTERVVPGVGRLRVDLRVELRTIDVRGGREETGTVPEPHGYEGVFVLLLYGVVPREE